MFNLLSRNNNLLVILVNDHFQVERDLFQDLVVQLRQIVHSLVPVHEEVGHGVFVVGLDALGHLFCQSWKAHRNQEVIFDLQTSDRTVILADDRS